MPLYEYQCRICNQLSDSQRRIDKEELSWTYCANCGALGSIKRNWGFSVRLSMPTHYNAAAGKVISNMGQLKSEFARMSDEAEMVTGNPHKFVPIDPMDKEALGVTDEGLDATHDRAVAEGRKEPAQRLVLP